MCHSTSWDRSAHEVLREEATAFPFKLARLVVAAVFVEAEVVVEAAGKLVVLGGDEGCQIQNLAWDHAGPETVPGESRAARYFFAAAMEAFLSAYFFVKRSTRPAVSISFCLPVKNGWQLEQISVRIALPLMVERVSNVLPQAQCTVTT
jgi:hypothetical protein